MEIHEENNCINCTYPIKENYCPNCGIPTKIEKIDRNYALQEGINLFGFEKGFLFTIRELLLRPGQAVHDYLTKNRYKYTKPLAFLIASSAIYTFIAHYLKVESVYQDKLEKIKMNSGSVNLIHWIQDNYGYSNILSTIFIIYWIKLFFKKHQYNFYEIAVLLFFIMGEGMIIFALMPVNAKYFGSTIFEILINIFSFSYIGWAIGQFFGRKFSNYVKAFFAYLFGYFSFIFVATILAIIYDKFISGR
jgi:Protein of unknown function (DUF3667)